MNNYAKSPTLTGRTFSLFKQLVSSKEPVNTIFFRYKDNDYPSICN